MVTKKAVYVASKMGGINAILEMTFEQLNVIYEHLIDIETDLYRQTVIAGWTVKAHNDGKELKRALDALDDNTV